MPDPMPDIAPLRPDDPARLGPYTLVGWLGHGGYGVVYLAEAAGAGRVAVKLLRTAMAEAGGERERFAREAAAVEQVARFCTAQVLDADIDGDRPYIVSEYVPGPSLYALVAEGGPLAGGALDRLAIGTATALVAIHQAGVIHRDFKPPNVLMGPDGPRVIDFGVARIVDRAATLTGHTPGTPAYMAPEQVSGGEVTPAVDVFAWGATMVYAASGTPPFGRDSLAVLAHRIVHEPPELGALTGGLRALVAECLAKDPAGRPSASALLMRLLGHTTVPGGRPGETAIMTEGMSAAAVPPPGDVARAVASPPETQAVAADPGGRRRGWPPAVAAAIAAVAVAGAAVAAVIAFHAGDRPPRPGPTTTVYTSGPGHRVPPASGGSSPRSSSPPGRPVARPTLYVRAGDCDLGAAGLTCTVTLRGEGAPVHWSATTGDPLTVAPASGSLNPGETATVTITLRPATPRAAGAATVTITGPGRTQTVQVTWEGEPSTDPSSG
ncbi:protein kinase domain-containing protein [Actinoallomurus sp. CA-142502]|uniref:protein kinase domain-containing protein n=1 Tax=Actinoallomurus sp. CA-142502 TaxID=3239885 RepID=UPI003D90883D